MKKGKYYVVLGKTLILTYDFLLSEKAIPIFYSKKAAQAFAKKGGGTAREVVISYLE